MKPLVSLLLALSVVTGAILFTPSAEACEPEPHRWYPETPSVTEIPVDGALPIVFDGRGVRLDDPENSGVTIRVQNQDGAGVNGMFRAYELPSTQTNAFGEPQWRRLVAWRPNSGWRAGESYTLTRVEESTSRQSFRTDFSHTFSVVEASAGEPSAPVLIETRVDVVEEVAQTECCTIPGCQTDCPQSGECNECWPTRYMYRARLAADIETFSGPHPSQWVVGFDGAEHVKRVSDVDSITITRDFVAGAAPYCAPLVALRIADGTRSAGTEVCETDLPDYETRGGSDRPAICDREVSDDAGMDAGFEDVPPHPPGDAGENTSVGSPNGSDIDDTADIDDTDQAGGPTQTGSSRGCNHVTDGGTAPVGLVNFLVLVLCLACFSTTSRLKRPQSID